MDINSFFLRWSISILDERYPVDESETLSSIFKFIWIIKIHFLLHPSLYSAHNFDKKYLTMTENEKRPPPVKYLKIIAAIKNRDSFIICRTPPDLSSCYAW